MRKDHLTTKQVEQYCQTGYLGTGERAHLAGCPECQRLVSDLRVIGRLLAKASPAEDEVHPVQDELQAFHDEALGFGRMKEVEAHLASCDHCLALVMELRVLDAGLKHATPTPHLIKVAQKRFRTPGPVRILGRLIIHTMKDTGAVILTLDPASVAASIHESFMPERSHDLALETDAMALRAKEMPDDVDVQYSLNQFLDAPEQEIPSSRLKKDSVEFESGGHCITINISADDEILVLRLSISTIEGDQPGDNISVHLFPGDGLSTDALTDTEGLATLPFESGPVLLQIDTDPPVQLEIAPSD